MGSESEDMSAWRLRVNLRRTRSLERNFTGLRQVLEGLRTSHWRVWVFYASYWMVVPSMTLGELRVSKPISMEDDQSLKHAPDEIGTMINACNCIIPGFFPYTLPQNAD